MCRRKETGEALMVGPFQTTWQYSCVRWEWGRQTQTEAEWCVGTRGAGSFTRIGEIAHKIRTKLNFDLSQSNIKLFYGKKKTVKGAVFLFVFCLMVAPWTSANSPMYQMEKWQGLLWHCFQRVKFQQMPIRPEMPALPKHGSERRHPDAFLQIPAGKRLNAPNVPWVYSPCSDFHLPILWVQSSPLANSGQQNSRHLPLLS